MSHSKGLLALSPLALFVCFYLGLSVAIGDFYKVPITVAFLLTSIYAVAATGRGTLKERVDCYCKGAASPGILLMIWIFVLAGAFAASAKEMGSIDATVNLTLHLLPPAMLLAGLFLAACFVSISIGTSVGTIVALVPIAAGVAEHTGQSAAFVTAVVVGGAFFGDNLSFISDTTIVATQSQGCRMSDKFRANIFLALPAALIVFVVYVFLGRDICQTPITGEYSLLKIIPYLVVLVTSVLGLDVMIVLTLGLLLTGAIGIADGSYDLFQWMHSMSGGILGMSELIVVTLMAGGLLATISQSGGIDYLIRLMTRRITGRRAAEATVGALVAMVDVCTANNTIAIITVGDITRQISANYGIDPRRAASLLDTFSCVMQGLIPYGAQLLMAAGIAAVAPAEIIPHLYYPLVLGIVALAAIVLRLPRQYYAKPQAAGRNEK